MLYGNKRHALIILVASVALAAPSISRASLVGTDNTTASAYSNGWQSGDDGFVTGDGAFGAWSFDTTGTSGSGQTGFFLGDSRDLASGDSGADINSSGSSFGMYAELPSGGLAFANAHRSFGALSVNQVVSIDLAVNFRATGFKGIDLRDGSNNTIFNFNVASDDYRVNGSSIGLGSGTGYSANTAFNLSFTQTSGSGGTWKVARSGGITDLDTGTYSGVPTNLKLYIGNTNVGTENNLFANNLSISAVPEASAFVAGGLICGLVSLAHVIRTKDRQRSSVGTGGV